ncbi:hypothetical protein MHYP_G00203920 [Metynnis hypsauchen]
MPHCFLSALRIPQKMANRYVNKSELPDKPALECNLACKTAVSDSVPNGQLHLAVDHEPEREEAQQVVD